MAATLGNRAAGWRSALARETRRGPAHGMASGHALACTLALVCGVFAGVAQDAAADDAPAAVLYATECASCHGANGRGNALVDGPVLAGLRASYIERQLESFRAGFRGANAEDPEGMEMRAAAVALDAASGTTLAAWLETLPAPLPETVASGDAALGAELYAPCAACHGERAEGMPALAAPALANQAPWYNDRQLRRFIVGVRGAHADDAWGTSMRASSVGVALDDVRHIVAWLSEQGGAAAATP